MILDFPVQSNKHDQSDTNSGQQNWRHWKVTMQVPENSVCRSYYQYLGNKSAWLCFFKIEACFNPFQEIAMQQWTGIQEGTWILGVDTYPEVDMDSPEDVYTTLSNATNGFHVEKM